jgi:hypothetical protein
VENDDGALPSAKARRRGIEIGHAVTARKADDPRAVLQEIVEDVGEHAMDLARRREIATMITIPPDCPLAVEHAVEATSERNDETADPRPERVVGGFDDEMKMIVLDGKVDDLKRLFVRALHLRLENATNERGDSLPSKMR